MEKLGKSKEPKKEIQEFQLDLPFEDAPEEEVIHLSYDELSELERTDPVAFKALMEKIKEKEEQEQEQAEIDEMERAAFARQKKEEEEEINKLRNSAIKDLDEDKVLNERDDSTGGYRHTAEIAQQKKEEEIQKQGKLNINKTKSKKSWWRKGGDSIRDILNRDNLR